MFVCEYVGAFYGLSVLLVVGDGGVRRCSDEGDDVSPGVGREMVAAGFWESKVKGSISAKVTVIGWGRRWNRWKVNDPKSYQANREQ